MRLSEHYRQVLIQQAQEVVGREVELILFGSRLDDSARGGDIDLLIKIDLEATELMNRALRLNARLQMVLGEQSIDIVTLGRGQDQASIHRHALNTGIRLC